jgi:protein-S-isoprenylcysteine O-methyltransferase Ste14
MSFQDKFERFFKLRFAILYPFGIFVILFANSDDQSMRIGIWFILVGLFLRMWANGYAIKLEKLTISGPYGFVRHPLYLGTGLLAVGFIIMLRIHYAGALLFLVMSAVYYRTIKNEEKMMEQKFGDQYINYKHKVPCIVPTIFPYRQGERWPFSFRRLIKSREYKLFIWMIILVIAFHLKEELWLHHEKISAHLIFLMGIILLLAMVDILGELLKWRKIEV